MVHESGPQKATLSPPKKMCGLSSVKSVAKSMFKPTANGTSPSMVAVAVNNTGVIRVLPASSMASRGGMPSLSLMSANSMSRIPFRTTIPAKATIPIPVITITKSMLKIPMPKSTPMILKIISERIMMVRLNELNCIIRIKKMRRMEIPIAPPKKAPVSFCSSCSPPITISTPDGVLNSSISRCNWATTSLPLNPLSTFDDKVMIRFWSLRLIPPYVLP